MALVKLDGKYGFINSAGYFVVPPQYDYAESFSGGMALVEQDGKYGFVDETGALAISLQFTKPYLWAEYSFSADGLAAVQQDGKWGYIDKTGQWVFAPQFASVNEFDKNGLARVRTVETANMAGRYGVINDRGEYVLPPEYDMVVIEKGRPGMFWCRKDDKLGWVDENGHWLFVAMDYSKDYTSGEEIPYVCISYAQDQYLTGDGYIRIIGYENGAFKAGVIDWEGNMIIEPKYVSIAYAGAEVMEAVATG